MKPNRIVEKGHRSLIITAYVVTIFFVVSAIIPVLWMLVSSLKTETDILAYPPKWTPSIPQSVQVTLDYSGVEERDALFYEKEAMKATWYPWMKNLRENIGEVKVTGVRDGQIIYRARTISSSFHVGQPLIVPSTLFNETQMNLKLPFIREQKLSDFEWFGEDGGEQASDGLFVSDAAISSKFQSFYSSTPLVEGKVTGIEERFSWIRMFDSYLALNKIAQDASGTLGFFQYFLNSTIVTLATVTIQLVLGGIAGYAISFLIKSKKWQFIWVMFFLATIMIPGISLLLPQYLLMKDLGLVNTLYAIILPHSAWGIVIFLFKGFFDQLPGELMQAARVDGASDFRIFSQIVVPLSYPVFTVVAVMTFIPVWNEFLWPLVVNNNPQFWTFTVALNDLQNKSSVQQNMVMASSLLSMVPLFIVFITSQKYIEKGVAFSGVKG
ncbi:multiple sugar transport system permease protein [Paenibacillus endophyticus]|uniref:Multiple sugar transport system permease protein n=1 Tax=Paenibacillus endophyticus TaxID=1294268 RepID=A0A7W5C3M6_9BACL|nr:carbohydrate ABC transporter permease [Paenibacillus endophyticus]MBB3150388.1 multiple sugar transport system permease protein [Paenibacillus endophyticus]